MRHAPLLACDLPVRLPAYLHPSDISWNGESQQPEARSDCTRSAQVMRLALTTRIFSPRVELFRTIAVASSAAITGDFPARFFLCLLL